jgi:hypothetical protein
MKLFFVTWGLNQRIGLVAVCFIRLILAVDDVVTAPLVWDALTPHGALILPLATRHCGAVLCALVRPVQTVATPVTEPPGGDAAARVVTLLLSLGTLPLQTPLLVRPIRAVVLPVTAHQLVHTALVRHTQEQSFRAARAVLFIPFIVAVEEVVALEGAGVAARTVAALKVVGVALVILTVLLVRAIPTVVVAVTAPASVDAVGVARV